MKNYQVTLSKSYIVEIKAENTTKAKQLAEFYTGDIADISTDQDRKNYGFEIGQMICGMNEAFEVKEITHD
jgi:hypothetical protein